MRVWREKRGKLCNYTLKKSKKYLKEKKGRNKKRNSWRENLLTGEYLNLALSYYKP